MVTLRYKVMVTSLKCLGLDSFKYFLSTYFCLQENIIPRD